MTTTTETWDEFCARVYQQRLRHEAAKAERLRAECHDYDLDGNLTTEAAAKRCPVFRSITGQVP